MKLTVKQCDNEKPGLRTRKVFDGRGLFLEIRPNGAKYWRMKYRYGGKEKLMALGVYPEVSLKDAREKCLEARRELDNGQDPMQSKKEQKRQIKENAENSFEVIAREWHDNKKGSWTERHAKTVLNRMENDLFPAIGSMPIVDIKPPHILTALKKIEKRGAFEPAHRMKQTCGQIFRYAIAKGIAETNPAADLNEALRPLKRGHYATLDIKELPQFLADLERNEPRLYLHTRLGIRLLMLTFVRTKELIEAKWDEFDMENGEWLIPGERMKMRKDHYVPLSRQVITILKQLQEMPSEWGWVFPGQVSRRKPMSNNTILFGLRRLGYAGRMTGHGFRALAMTTIKEKLGYRHEVIDRQLAHAKKNKIIAAYDRAEFMDERRKMMQEWADYIDKVGKNV
tara:strand:+ start:535 stop:1725 length:1191 start_codon:yes stop_codon:yes gene_type:complete